MDPHLVNVARHSINLQKEIDDILWNAGVNDPRIAALAMELAHYKKLEAEGVVHEPTF